MMSAFSSDAKPPTMAALESTLRDADKSIEELQHDVAAAQKRTELRATIARADELEQGRAAITEQLAAAKEILDAAQATHDETVGPLRFKIDAINQARHAASSAEQQLRELIDDDHDEQLTELRRQLNAATERVGHVRKELDHVRAHTPRAIPASEWESVKASPTVNPTERAEYEAAVKRAEQRLVDAQAAADVILQQQTDLVTQAMAS